MNVPTPIPRPGPGRITKPLRAFEPTPRPTIRETSAGGVVIDAIRGVYFVALLARRNKASKLEWCLPKGHVEAEESVAAAALREVREETGLEAAILSKLGFIDYWFHVDRNRVHKMVHHYLMRATGGELTTHNDPDAEGVDVAWVPAQELVPRLSFTNERRIAKRALEAIDNLP